ncbi:MAG TPA: GYF domain-containing protein [Kofleriaceae bacterium]|nr:GYF domain-containing protein [Kofleriaceae bacterium]
MKFLCDRCKTRYSIADERVRGKILKIRCKNCANVISVREGMTDADVDASAPAPQQEGSALQNAFATAMIGARPGETQPPPPVLEEEWYVAIDGNQSGPFTLAEAQAWVGSKTPTEDLYCWCEGFDDWLPVEKVSHFRGLRGKREETPKPAGAAKSKASGGTPLAAAPTAPSQRKAPAAAPPPDEEPKPLFAATLAKLEAEQSGLIPLPGPPGKNGESKAPAPKKLEPLAATPPKKPEPLAATPPKKPEPVPLAALAAKAPGASRAPLPMPTRNASPPISSSSSPARGAVAGSGAVASAAPAAATATATAPALREPEPAAALPKPMPSGKSGPARRPMFDTGEAAEEPEHLDESALEDEPEDNGGDDLEIGEVSRVVRLPDLMAAGARAAAAKPKKTMGRTTGSNAAIARGTGAAPALAAAAGAAALGNAGQGIDGDALPPLSDAALADAHAPLSPSVSRRNHQVMWMIGGAALLLGVIVVAAVAASSSGGAGEQVSTGNIDVTGLGYTYDPLRPRGSDNGTGSGSVTITGTRIIKRTGNGGNGGNGSQSIQTNPQGSGRQEIGPNGEPITPLTGDDIISVSSKMSMGTSRCYERALKKDPFLSVQKINVSLKVDKSGVVTDVSLDSHASDDLGQCLTAAIRRWPFRQSTEGINTVFPLVFQQH